MHMGLLVDWVKSNYSLYSAAKIARDFRSFPSLSPDSMKVIGKIWKIYPSTMLPPA